MPSLAQLLLMSCIALLTSCDGNSTPRKKLNQLEKIRHNGTLQVLTRFDSTTYFEGPDGFTGLEYELVTLFAKHLGVEVQFSIPGSFDQILNEIADGKADIAAAGLTITPERKEIMRFASPYHFITEQVIYRSGTRRPKIANDLSKGILEVVKGTSHITTLKGLQAQIPNLQWNENLELDTDGLLYLVNEGLIDYTIADSNQVKMLKRFYPKLHVAFDISPSRALAWALPKTADLSLYHEMIRFFEKIKKNKTLVQLIDRHYGHTNKLNYFDLCKFREHRKNRLTVYEELFRTAAEKYQIDWRLLASIGYQESHWQEKAISPTGVKGIMMLTNATAKQLGVKNRINPEQSIHGGAQYFKKKFQQIPARIPEPDRTWLALAAYNVGHGHLEDARILTQKRGGNPDKWLDVKQALPLLSIKKWYKQTKHGYARGKEPVRYVENIRGYYDLLVWLTEEDKTKINVMTTEQIQDQNPLDRILEINSPAL